MHPHTQFTQCRASNPGHHIYVHVYMCVPVHVCMCVYTCVHMYVCMCICVCTHVCLSTCACVYIHVCVCTCVCVTCVYVCVHVCVHVYACLHVYACVLCICTIPTKLHVQPHQRYKFVPRARKWRYGSELLSASYAFILASLPTTPP